jgi:hypothetical protein
MLVDAENSQFNCTHPIIASLLIKNWGLLPVPGQAIRFHHEPDAYELPDQTLPVGALSLIGVTRAAEFLVAERAGGQYLDVDADIRVSNRRLSDHHAVGREIHASACCLAKPVGGISTRLR